MSTKSSTPNKISKAGYFLFIQFTLLLLVLSSKGISQTVTIGGRVFTGVEFTYCITDASDHTWACTNPNTKKWQGDGITDADFGDGEAVFNAASAGLGTHTITYWPGSSKTEFDVEVISPPTSTLTAFADVCEDDAAFFLSGGSPAGGVYVINGTDTITSFLPATYGVGTHTVVYVAGGGACTDDSDSETIDVLGPSTITFSGISSSYCLDAADVNFTYSPAGGTFTAATGLTDNGAGSATFSPSTSGVATRNIEYTYTNSGGCESTKLISVEVKALPILSIIGLTSSYCINASDITISGNNAPSGTFSGPGITDNGDGTATFSPSSLTVGGSPYTISYTYTDPGTTCSNVVTQDVTIKALPTAAISGAETICIGDAGTLDVTFTGIGPAYNFTYTDGTSSVNLTNKTSPYSLSVSPTVTSTYTISSVTQPNGCSQAGTGSGTITVNPVSVITGNPSDDELCPGDNATFTVTATGVNLSYQWQKDGGDISGATSSTYNINNVSASDAADYQCVVSSDCGPDLTSSAATLDILTTTAITVQPSDVTSCEGTNISFTVTAIGENLSYQWKKDGVAMVNGGDIGGVTTNNLLISNIETADEANYTCVVTGDCGNETSVAAALLVNDDIVIGTQPTSKSVCPGSNTSFSVAVTGTSPTYQWKKNNVNISGATTPTLSLTSVVAGDAGSYKCVITGTCGAVTSNTVTLTVYQTVSITLQPTPISTCEGATANLNVSATGTIVGYQWQKGGVNVSNGADISGATTANLQIDNLTTGNSGSYTCIVDGQCGDVTTSSAALVVDEAIVITTNISDKEYCENDPVFFSIVASGTNLTYQWFKDGAPMAGKTSTGLSFAAATPSDEATYQCTVSNSCSPKSSNAVSLTMNDPTVLVTEPSDDVVCEGDNASMAVTATGSNLTYSWTHNAGAVNDVGSFSGSSTASLLITNLDISYAGQYIAEVVGSCGTESTAPAFLTVNENVVITTQPTSKSVCPGDNTSFKVTVTGTSPTYQWQKNNVNISGATSATLNLSSVSASDAGNYKCIVTGSCGPVTSNQVSLTVYEVVTIDVQPTGLSTCEGATADFDVSASGTITGYQWQKGGVNITNGGDISGATSANLTITNLTTANSGAYTCIVSGSCGSVTTSSAVLVVDEAIAITTQPTSQNYCETDNIVLTTVATGTNLLYQWKKNGSSMAGKTSSSLTITGAAAGDEASYFCLVSNSCSPVSTNIAVLTMDDPTVIVTNPSGSTVCEGDNLSMNVSATGTGLTYAWTKNGTPISDVGSYGGTSTNTLTFTGVTVSYSGSYVCQVTGSCGTESSSAAALTVNQNIAITSQPTSKSVCPGSNTSFKVTATGTAPTYQWQKDGVDISGATTATYNLNSVTAADAANYKCIVTGYCGAVTSTEVSLTVYEEVSIDLQPTAVYTCVGSTADFDVSASGTITGYQWQKDGVNLTNGANVSGATSANLTLTSLTTSNSGSYTCVVTGPCGSETSSVAALVADESIVISTHPTTQSFCASDNIVLTTATSSGTNLTYQWKKNGSAMAGKTQSSLTITGATAGDAATYFCTITNSCNSSTSNAAVLTLNAPTVITSDPSNATVCEGDNASLSVSATGSNLTYSWTDNGVAVTDVGAYSGSSTASLSITSLDVSYAGVYVCEVSGSCGTESSSSATLTVNEAIVITTQPTSKSVCPGNNTSFKVTVTGSNPTYQWQKNNVNISGATSATLNLSSVAAGDAGSYKCIITGSCGAVTSNSVTLVVYEEVSIDVQPTAIATCVGTAADFDVVALGTITAYQWKKDGTNVTNGGTISGATSANLSISNLTVANTGNFTCNITGQCNSVTTNSTSLIVDEDITITTHPASQTFCATDDIFLSVVATGTNLLYQWYKNGSAMSGKTSSDLVISGSAAGDAGSYYCRVTNSCNSIASNIANLTLNNPTVITSEPSDDTVCEGDNSSMTVTATGSNLTYTWNKDGAPIANGGSYSGATTGSLVITGLDVTYDGVYVCDVSGSCGDLSTTPAVLTVNEPIVITTQPTSNSICNGSNTSFNVAVTGTNPTYQWQRNNVNVSGATSATLSLTAVTSANAGTYKCIVTGSCGPVTTSLVTLTVYEDAVITAQPAAVNSCVGATANFDITATGSIIGYQWKKGGVDLTDGGDISGATTPNLSIANLATGDAGAYTCEITGYCGSVTSNTALMVVDEAITITTNPSTQAVCAGDNVVFELIASGTNLQYQWYKSGGLLSGETGTSLVISGAAASDAGPYYCQVINSCSPKTSNVAILSLNNTTAIGTQPVADVVCEGDNANFSVIASGSNLTYAWTKDGSPISDGGSYSGTTSSSLVISSLDVSYAGLYICEVSGSCGDVNSTSALLTVNENIVITVQPTNKTVCPGTNVQFSVTATGSGLSYQWKKDNVDIPGETGTNLILLTVTDANEGTYQCAITGDCGTKQSNAVSLTVTDAVTILTQPSDDEQCEGSDVSFNVLASGTSVSYQWKKNGIDIGGATSGTLNLTSITESDEAVYSCKITNTCGSKNTVPANLIVDEDVSMTSEPVDFNAVEAGSASFSVTADGDIVSYQWYKTLVGALTNGAKYSGVTTEILDIANLVVGDAGDYYCIVTGICNAVQSNPGHLNVSSLTLITAHPTDPGDKCEGESATLTVGVTGAVTTYQWSKDGVAMVEDAPRVTGTQTSSLAISSLVVADGGSYSCLVSDGTNLENSYPVTFAVSKLTDITVQPSGATQCEGDDALFVTDATGTNLTYQWQSKYGGNIVDDPPRITGATTKVLSIQDLLVADTATYICAITGSGCGNDVTDPATLVVNENTVITTEPSSKTRCTGTAATFSVVADGNNTYQWKKNGVDMVPGADPRITGVNTKDLTISPVQTADAAEYSCLVTGPCAMVNTIVATLTVNTQTSITKQPSATKTLCQGDDAIFTIEALGSDLTFKWRKNGLDLADGSNISGSDTKILEVSDITGDDAGSYQCLVSGTCSNLLSDASVLTVNELVDITTDPSNATKCVGQSVTFSVITADPSNTYQWKKNGVNLTDGGKFADVTTANLSITGITEAEAGAYSCQVSSLCDDMNSGLAILTVRPVTAITSQPLAQAVDEGFPVSFTVEAVGYNLTYQWEKDGTPIAGATSKTYTIVAAVNADEGDYTCRVTGDCNQKVSDPANLEVYQETVITTEPLGQTKCEGASAAFVITATGESLTYQWKKDGVDLTDGGNISGATTPNITISSVALSDAATYACVVTGDGGTVSSGAVSLNVNKTTTMVTQPLATQEKCEGEEVYFIVSATGATLTYQWKKDGSVISDGANISGALTKSLSVSNAVVGDEGVYECSISGTCGNITSNPSTLTINENVSIVGNPVSKTRCVGTSATFSVTSADLANTYYWKKNGVKLSEGGKYTGVQTPNLSIDNITSSEAGVYSCLVKGQCDSINSGLATLTVQPATVVTTQPLAQEVDEGVSVTFTVEAIGTSLSYQWQKDGTNISGATSNTYTIASALNSDEGAYTCTVAGTCNTAISDPANLVVNIATAITTNPVSQTKCEGTSATFTVAAGGESLTYQWNKDGTVLADIAGKIAGSTANILTISTLAVADVGSYTCVVTGSGGVATSSTASLSVNTTTAITTQPASTKVICEDKDAYFITNASGASLVYSWEKGGVALSDAGNISGSSTKILTVSTISSADAGVYRCVVSGLCSSATTNSSTLTVNDNVIIVSDPIDKTSCVGESATFSVLSADLTNTFHWKLNGIKLTEGGKYTGVQTANLTVDNLTTIESGVYSCLVSGDCDSVNSELATLTVLPATAINTQPISQTVAEGVAVSFSVNAVGNSLTYQWRKNGIAIAGATSNLYTIASPVNGDEGSYTCFVTGTCNSVLSSSATLVVNIPTGISTNPSPKTKCVGEDAVFTLTASGENLTYEWRKDGIALTNTAGEISGATTRTLTLTAVAVSDIGTYTCVVSGSGGSQTTNAVSLDVNTITTIVSQPAPTKDNCVGQEVYFVVSATGANLTYAWQKDGVNLSDGGTISGSATNILSISSLVLADAGVYRCVVSGTCESVTSNPSTLAVTDLVILTNPVDRTKCVGESASFSVISGSPATNTFHWKKNGALLTDGGAYTGVLTSTLTIDSVTTAEGGVYSCLVTGDCDNINSGLATLTILPTTVITVHPIQQNVAEGIPVTFSVEAQGNSLTYQWQKDGTDIAGATSNFYTIAAASNADEAAYTCLVSGTCNSSLSDPASLIVNSPTVIVTNPVDQSKCEGFESIFSVTATGEHLVYSWRKNGVALTDVLGKITGSASNKLTVSVLELSDIGTYSCIVSGDGGTVSTGTVNLDVGRTTTINSQPSSLVARCEGEDAVFVIDAIGENLTYSWQKDGAAFPDGGNIFGSANEVLSISNMTTAEQGVYRCEVSGTCGTGLSEPSTLTVDKYPATPGTIIGDDILCQAETDKSYEVPVIANADSYDWFLPYGATIEGDETGRHIIVNFELDALGGNITVRGRNSCGVGSVSAPLSITVNTKPLASAGFDQSLCTANTTLAANNNPNGVWTILSGFASFADDTQYNTDISSIKKGQNKLIWTVTENNCTSRDTVIITNNLVSLNAGEDKVLCGNTTTLNASTPTAGTGSWIVTSGGANIVSVNNPASSVVNIQRGANVLEWTINNNGCISRDTVVITNDMPTAPYAGPDTILFTDIFTLEGSTPIIGTGRWSLSSGSGTLVDPVSPTSDITNLGIAENTFKWVITNNACFLEDEVKVINYTPSVVEAGENQALCSDSTSLFGSPPNYGYGQWTVVQGSGDFANDTDRETEVTNLGQGINVFKWTVHEYLVISDTVVITNNAPVNAKAGIDQNLCGTSTVLAANNPTIGTGKWTIRGGSGTISNLSSYNSAISNLGAGTNTLRWTITNGSCSSYDDVFINNNIPTQADAGVDQQTCADSIELFPNNPSIGTGEWTIVSGSAIFEGNKAYSMGIDDNYFRWAITNKGCVSSDTVLIVSHKPTKATTLSQKSICVDSMFLPGNTPQYGTGEWTIVSGSATLADKMNPSTLASNLGSGLNRFRWTIKYQECVSSSEFNLSYDLIPADAGEDQVLCDNVAIMSASNPGVGTGQWTIVGGSGAAVFSDPNFTSSEVTSLDRGSNILKWTITNKSCISSDQVTITNNNPSDAYAGADRSVCGEVINLNANIPNIGTGEWSVLSGSATIADPVKYNTQITDLSIGVNTLRWTVSHLGCTSTDDVVISNDQPTFITAGLDQFLCSNTAKLYASDPAGGTGLWSIAKGSAAFADNTDFDTDVSGLEKGVNNLVWTVTIGGCTFSDTVLIANNLPSTPSAGPDQDVCDSETFLAANAPQIGSGHWSIVSGAATFENANDPYTKITEIGNGVNKLNWITTNGSCQIGDEVLITNSLPTVAYAGEDRAVCNTTANLLANPALTGSGEWTVVSGFGIIEDPSDYNTQISSLGFGPNTLRWTTVNGRCTSIDDVIIKNNLAIVSAGVDQVTYQPSVQLNGNKPAAGIGEWKIVAGQGTLTDPNNFKTTISALGEGANTLYWTINNDGCIATDNVIITYYVLPEVAFTPTPPQGCPPLTVDFLNGSVGGFPYTWELGDGTVTNETSPKHTYYDPGTYQVRLTGTGPDGILVVKDTVVVVYEHPDVGFEVAPDLVYVSDPPSEDDLPVNYYNQTTIYDSLVWDFGDGETSNAINPLHKYLETGVYDVTLHAYTEFNCYDFETQFEAVTVELKGSIECPNVFTPNLGGGAGGTVDNTDYSNDIFHCFSQGLLNYHLEIFNRLGVLMFETEDVNLGWDGYFNGDLAPEGIYVYRISGKYNNGEKYNQTGTVMIIYNE